MIAPILTAAFFLVATTGVHVASLAIAVLRLRRAPSANVRGFIDLPAVSLVRPLCGIDNFAEETLRSTFGLSYPRYEILFCVASANDPVSMAKAMRLAVQAGRLAFKAGRMGKKLYATASSPLEGVPDWTS